MAQGLVEALFLSPVLSSQLVSLPNYCMKESAGSSMVLAVNLL